jgi:septum formation protein
MHLNKFFFNIILGSSSPRRNELLKSLGFDFVINPSNADEDYPLNLKGHEIPVFLAEKKASSFNGVLTETDLLITADTIVWCEGEIFNKPINFEEGKLMLQTLSGKMHEVFTAVCLKSANKQIIFYDATKVYFKKFTNEEIEYYLNKYKPYDKAGSYGVQEWIGYIGIEKIEGSFYNVMGLPVKKLHEELMKF